MKNLRLSPMNTIIKAKQPEAEEVLSRSKLKLHCTHMNTIQIRAFIKVQLDKFSQLLVLNR